MDGPDLTSCPKTQKTRALARAPSRTNIVVCVRRVVTGKTRLLASTTAPRHGSGGGLRSNRINQGRLESAVSFFLDLVFCIPCIALHFLPSILTVLAVLMPCFYLARSLPRSGSDRMTFLIRGFENLTSLNLSLSHDDGTLSSPWKESARGTDTSPTYLGNVDTVPLGFVFLSFPS